MKKVIIGDQSFEINFDNKKVIIDGKEQNFELFERSDGNYLLRLKNKVYQAQVLEHQGNDLTTSLNGVKIQSVLKSEQEILLEELGMEELVSDKNMEILAPMPGLIIEILVEEGQEIKKGDSLLILEAMKMENVIKAPSDGVVSSLHVKKNESVDKNQKLINF